VGNGLVSGNRNRAGDGFRRRNHLRGHGAILACAIAPPSGRDCSHLRAAYVYLDCAHRGAVFAGVERGVCVAYAAQV
jgi:hypothetical protein